MYPRNKYWNPLVKYLKKQGLEDEFFLAPEVLLYDFPKVLPYQILKHIRLSDYNWEYVVFHKKLPEDMTNNFLDMLRKEYQAVWANHLFVILKKHPSRLEKLKASKYLFSSRISWKKYYKKDTNKRNGILITTYNRPQYLERLLEQLKGRPEEIMVVNDGSDKKFMAHYNQIKKDFPRVNFINNSKNIGLVFSMNTGFAYFLSDPDVEWIHYFQDDVLIEEDLFEKTAKVAHHENFPVITGMHREPHKICKADRINGIDVFFLRSAPAHHLFMHRQYLMDNLPIPNPYVGAPKPGKGRPGQGSDADWWLLSWSPKSIVKRDGYIVAIPGLVHTDMNPELSTWAES